MRLCDYDAIWPCNLVKEWRKHLACDWESRLLVASSKFLSHTKPPSHKVYFTFFFVTLEAVWLWRYLTLVPNRQYLVRKPLGPIIIFNDCSSKSQSLIDLKPRSKIRESCLLHSISTQTPLNSLQKNHNWIYHIAASLARKIKNINRKNKMRRRNTSVKLGCSFFYPRVTQKSFFRRLFLTEALRHGDFFWR